MPKMIEDLNLILGNKTNHVEILISTVYFRWL